MRHEDGRRVLKDLGNGRLMIGKLKSPGAKANEYELVQVISQKLPSKQAHELAAQLGWR